ncbi:YqjF family protein [Flavobacterium dankookense]|uniref:DUF2071 domain-containing protein n=1 Tax=Flavobacterium dankookense TaxID=706186 RepID=A0A4R6QFB2_9FLAO|nr:DUF2071 domain-containing protein [Flavobacterium dankookense]TDP61155.1 hypothetical protein BC748_0768 [Flavobacterium dankookense]
MSTFLKADWENIIMANYAIAPELLEPYLPKGVTLDLFQGKAYVSLVGFMFKNTKLFNVPIPKLGTFEEINLRFYVKRVEGTTVKRGVVFINETIPYRIVAWVANKLYNEHYTVVPTRHEYRIKKQQQQLTFEWLRNKKWNSIYVKTDTQAKAMQPNSFEEFIYEHYLGYTKVNEKTTEEYRLKHPSWELYTVEDYKINCDFKAMYGEDFSVLDSTKPSAVFVAKGSSVKIEWKRNRIKTAHERS